MGENISNDLDSKVAELEKLYSTGFNSIKAVLMRKYRYPTDQAEDLVQDAFVRGLRAIKSYNAQASMFTWMTRIACNLAISDLRRRKSYAERIADMQRQDTDLTANTTVERPDRRIGVIEYLDACKNALPPSYAETWMLRCIEHQYHEIANEVGCRKGTVMSRLCRGRRILEDKGIEAHAYF